MKEIKAIIQPFQLEKVLAALQSIVGLPGCIVSNVATFGRQNDHGMNLEAYDRSKLEIVVSDEMVDAVVETIQKSAHTGRPGDGKIFVIECRDVVRIRTAEHGPNAL